MTGCVQTRADAAFAKLALEAGQPVLVALSGGADSTALLHLFHRFVRAHRPDLHIIAATVDHGLRPQSAAEARQVMAACAAASIDHRTLTRSGGDIATGIQARARRARYALLAGLARDLGASVVLTGHTADDQAETIAMRLARAINEDGIGLAGIDPATLHGRQVWFVRPLLGFARADLRTWLERQGIGFIDDPSNADRRFERVRVRQRLAKDPAERAKLLQTAQTHAANRQARARAAAICLADRSLWRGSKQTMAFDAARASQHDQAAQLAAISAVLTGTGRLAHQPDDNRAQTALGFCQAAANGQAFTIAGCRLYKNGGLVVFTREPRNRRAAQGMSFDNLLVSADWPMAQALARLNGWSPYAAPPFTTIDTNTAQ